MLYYMLYTYNCTCTVYMHMYVVVYLQKLVHETFRAVWFIPLAEKPESCVARLHTRVTNITNAVNGYKETGYTGFKHLLESVRTLLNWCEIALTQDCENAL